jgi:hypothetical protein
VALRTILSDVHWIADEDADHRVLFLRRTPVAFDSLDEIAASNARLVAVLREEHASWGVVLDMRQAPPRNDPQYEDAMKGLRTRIGGLERIAWLLESAAGVLQVNRLARDEGSRKTFATMSEPAALRFARG